MRKLLVALMLAALAALVANTALAGPGGPWDIFAATRSR